jgi:hypothetical protein
MSRRIVPLSTPRIDYNRLNSLRHARECEEQRKRERNKVVVAVALLLSASFIAMHVPTIAKAINQPEREQILETFGDGRLTKKALDDISVCAQKEGIPESAVILMLVQDSSRADESNHRTTVRAVKTFFSTRSRRAEVMNMIHGHDLHELCPRLREIADEQYRLSWLTRKVQPLSQLITAKR